MGWFQGMLVYAVSARVLADSVVGGSLGQLQSLLDAEVITPLDDEGA